MTRRAHADLIIEWANDDRIEVECNYGSGKTSWYGDSTPQWVAEWGYRLVYPPKPKKVMWQWLIRYLDEFFSTQKYFADKESAEKDYGGTRFIVLHPIQSTRVEVEE